MHKITTNQLNNLIGFALNFYQLEITNLSPDYIKEKWDQWIKCDPNIRLEEELRLYVKDIPIIRMWTDRWKYVKWDNDEYKYYRNILYFIHILQNSFPTQGLEILTRNYEDIIGETYLINDDKLDFAGIHPTIKNHLLPFLRENNKDVFREVQLQELLTN